MKKITFILLFLCACVSAFSQPQSDSIYKSCMNSAYDYIKKVYNERVDYQKYMTGARVLFVVPRYTLGPDNKIDSLITMIDFEPDSLSFYAIALSDSAYFQFSTDKGISKKWHEINLERKEDGLLSSRFEIIGYDPDRPADYDDFSSIDFENVDSECGILKYYSSISDYLSKLGRCFWFDIYGFTGLWVLDSSNHLSRITFNKRGKMITEDGEEYYQKCLKKIGEEDMRTMGTGDSPWIYHLHEKSIIEYVGKD